MKRLLIVSLLLVLGLGLGSCQKSRYCQCYAIVEGETTVSFGEELSIGDLTASQLDSLPQRYRYNLFVVDRDRSCQEKENEILGWGEVRCEEAVPKRDDSWFHNLFNRNKNNNNSSHSNNH